MHWKTKALFMQLFSSVPFGATLHYCAQRFVSKSLPMDDKKFLQICEYAKKHVDAFKRCHQIDLAEASFFEFGAGWELVIPLAFYAYGVNDQTLVDIRRLLKPELVNDTINKFSRYADCLPIRRVPSKRVPENFNGDWTPLLKEWYGINYLAPRDARSTELPSASVDFITSTNTLEHIPPRNIREILTECNRILRVTGALSFIIDYQDHYSYSDSQISAYNFLRFSAASWNKYNPRLHHQNRLRHKDYLGLLQSAGFEIKHDCQRGGTEQDLNTLYQLQLHLDMTTAYTLEELSIRDAHLVIQKNGAQVPTSKFQGAVTPMDVVL